MRARRDGQGARSAGASIAAVRRGPDAGPRTPRCASGGGRARAPRQRATNVQQSASKRKASRHLPSHVLNRFLYSAWSIVSGRYWRQSDGGRDGDARRLAEACWRRRGRGRRRRPWSWPRCACRVAAAPRPAGARRASRCGFGGDQTADPHRDRPATAPPTARLDRRRRRPRLVLDPARASAPRARLQGQGLGLVRGLERRGTAPAARA